MTVHTRVRNPRGEGSRLRTELVDAASRLLEALVSQLPGRAATTPTERVLALWTVLDGVVSLRTGRPGYPWPPPEEHVRLALAEVVGVRS